MSEVVASENLQVDLDKVVQSYFRQRQKNLKPSDIEGLIKNFDYTEERDQQSALAKRA